MSNINSIIGGCNNTVTGSTAIIGGHNNTAIGICGPQGLYGTIGVTGMQGTSGPAGYMTDWKQIIMDKYNNRFIIKTEYNNNMTFAPTNIIIDIKTGEEYKFQPSNMSDIMNETDRFIQRLIIEIRDQKITNIING